MYNSNGLNFNWNDQNNNTQQIFPQMNRPLYSMNAPRYEVIRVNGRNGAENFRMAPNSSALLLDNTASIVWFVQTDGAGYLTAAPFDVTPHQTPKPVDMNDLSDRVTKLEELMINVQQSNNSISKQSKKQRQLANEATSSNEPTSGSTI